MRLEEWLFKWLSINWGEVPPDAGKEDWHVIGTCGECKLIGDKAITLSQHGTFFCSINGRYEKEDFGCIHFEPKNK